MVRIKYTALVKLFAIFFFALFIIPSLLKLLNGPDEGGTRELGNGDGGGQRHLVDNNQRRDEQEENNQKPQNTQLAAVFKDGVIGNYEEVNPEVRTGPGEGGVGVETEANMKGTADATVREFGFNMYASDKISLDRRIKDTRPAEY